MISRYYFMKTTTVLLNGEKMYNSVLRRARSWFRDDKAAHNAMYEGVRKKWEGNTKVIHVTDFRRV